MGYLAPTNLVPAPEECLRLAGEAYKKRLLDEPVETPPSEYVRAALRSVEQDTLRVCVLLVDRAREELRDSGREDVEGMDRVLARLRDDMEQWFTHLGRY